MPDSSSDRDPLEVLAEEFAARLRQGERPSLTEYAARLPGREAEVRDLFPALAEIEHLKPATGEHTGAYAPAAHPGDPDRVGEFRILRRVGVGGMGAVYEAVQESLGRHVALKLLPVDALLDPKRLERFRREAKSAARLHHTNIVPVFGVGESDGRHYYAMQFIAGHPLDAVIDEVRRLKEKSATVAPTPRSVSEVAAALLTGTFGRPVTLPSPLGGEGGSRSEPGEGNSSTRPLTPNPFPPGGEGSQSPSLSGSLSDGGHSYWATVALIGSQAADALAYAHAQGILHRDIKPANLLLDLQGTVWVTDFGLAKATDTDDLTQMGDIVGTLRYMAPERFDGQGDHRADVYALGLTLYELLTLTPAFHADNRAMLVEQVLAAAPPPPRGINPTIPRDLETVVLKAVARDPAMRYQTATDLAEDLRRYVEDRPIRARRASKAEQAWRWCRRNKAVASLIATVATLLVGVTVAAVVAAAYFDGMAEEERLATQRETEQRQAAEDARRDRERTLTDTYTSSGLDACTRDDPRQAVLWFAEAARLAGDDRERAAANRIRAAAWGRLTVQPVRAFEHPAEWVENNMAFHPGGRHLLTHGSDLTTGTTDCRLWDLERETALPFPGHPAEVSAAAWDAGGGLLAVGTPRGEVAICRFPGGDVLQRIQFAGRITRVLFSPDGHSCAIAAADRARVWDCHREAWATPELKHPAPVATLAIHPRGELLATGCRDDNCRVFAMSAERDAPLFTEPHLGPEFYNAGHTHLPPLFLDEGRGLLTVSKDEASWRDPRTGRVIRELPFGDLLSGAAKQIRAISLSGDGKHLVLASGWPENPHVRVYDVATAKEVSENLPHRSSQPVWSAAFSPDGRRLLTGSGDHTARLWSVPEGKALGDPLTHPTSVSAVAFSPDGRHLATAQRGGLIRLWALPAGNPRDYRVILDAWSNVRLSPDGRFLLPTGLNMVRCELRKTQVIDLATGRWVGSPLEAHGFLMDAAFSPDGLQVAAAVSTAASSAERKDRPERQSGQLLLWDWRAGRLRHGPLPLPAEPRQLDYSPDGRQLAVLGADGVLVVVDPAMGMILHKWRVHTEHWANSNHTNNGALRFSPDGRLLLTFGTNTNSARVWDAATAQQRHELGHESKCHDVQFSPDGELVATAAFDNWVYVWELATGRRLARLRHPDWVFTARFSPDGRQLLTAGRDGMARLWDWRDNRLACPPFRHEHEVHAVAFTPDGRHVLSAGDDRTLRIWEWRTGKQVCPPFALRGAALSLAVTPDGTRVAVGGFMQDLPVFHLDDWLTPSPLGPDDLCLWAEVVSGQRIEGGGVTNLTAEEWWDRWREFRRRHPGHVLAP